MKKSLLKISAFLLVFGIVFQSCNKEDDDDPTPAPKEFIATDATFADFMSWPLDATAKGPDPALGPAHGGNDTSVTRNVYYKDGQSPVDGEYPLGTVIVKRSTNASGMDEKTAMVKRGNNFNPGLGDWEFFMLDADNNIAEDMDGIVLRGAALMGGMCGGCHSQASAKDFIFTK